MKDNFTHLGYVEFYNYTAFLNDSQVFFEKEVQFYDDVYFEGHVKLEGDVTNSHYDIDFKVDDKVRVNFSPDYAIRINKGTIFAHNVDIRKDLKVNGDASVLGHTYLGATDIDGYLSVSDVPSMVNCMPIMVSPANADSRSRMDDWTSKRTVCAFSVILLSRMMSLLKEI